MKLQKSWLIIVAIVSGIVGCYFIINSLAATPCTPDLNHLTAAGCPVTKSDTAVSGDPNVIKGLWGNIECADLSRLQLVPTDGDPHVTASGTPQGNTSYYKMTAMDGDDFYGERCELGRNERRYGENGGAGTFQLYQEGEHKVTFASIRLPVGFPVGVQAWQTILQMKQTQPTYSAGLSPIIEMQEFGNQFIISSDPAGILWTTPAATGQWVRFAFDVTYSKDNSKGKIKVYVDLNGDGDTLDANEQSPVITTATLATETDPSEPPGPILQTGDPVPGHLRIGLYHNPSYNCPAPNGCSINDDNVQVVDLTDVSTTPPPPPPPADTTNPTVSLSSPANGATVSGTVTATAAASDNVGVSKVEISVDGTLKTTDTTGPYSYSFDSKTLTNGLHTLTAKAYDAVGNTATTTITVTVSNPDTTPPNTPTNLNATALNATTVNLTWTAATDTGLNATGVVKYNVLRNGAVIAQPTTNSYTDAGRTANTTYSYVIQAVDGAGNVSASSAADSVTTPAGTTSTLLFNGAKLSDYGNQSAPGSITSVADPLGSSQQVFKMVVKNTDVAPVTPTADPRAQLLSPAIINNGDDFWWGAKFLLPSDFPSSVPGWLNILEGAYGPPFNNSPPWQIQANGTNLAWVRNGTYGYDVPWSMPIVKNQWISVVMHEKLSSSGFVEMWVNGQRVTFFPTGSSNYNPSNVAPTTHLTMQTWDSSNNGGANFVVLQSYRKLGMFDSVTLYHWPTKLGTTQASVTDATPPPSTPDTTAPTVPSAVQATAVSTSQVNISWNASTDSGGSGLAGYNIYRNGTKLNSSIVTSTSYGDTTVDDNTTYSYRIEAVDGAGNKSAQTSAVSVKTPAVVRGDITGSTGVPDGKINLFDMSYVIRNYNTTNANGDITGSGGTRDGKVDLYDISYIIRNYSPN